MLIKEYVGYELEKEKSNTSEDFFNRSEVTFVEDGEVRTLHVLYLRFFDEFLHDFTPYKQDPVWSQGDIEVLFKEIVALVCLMKNPGLRHRKRLYINSKVDFATYFQNIDYNKLPEILLAVKEKGQFELRSPLEYILKA